MKKHLHLLVLISFLALGIPLTKATDFNHVPVPPGINRNPDNGPGQGQGQGQGHGQVHKTTVQLPDAVLSTLSEEALLTSRPAEAAQALQIMGEPQVRLIAGVPDGEGIIYVDSAVAVPGDGSSWAGALQYLSEATEAARENPTIREIHIAKGTYYPAGDKSLSNRDSSFWVTRPGLKILGGYAAGGNERNRQLYPTVLSGDIGTLGDYSDNSKNVLIITDIDKDADSLILDGLTITGGMADEDDDGEAVAGGISIFRAYANTVVSNCRFIGNHGLFVSALGISGAGEDGTTAPGLLANPQILNCLFRDNEVEVDPALGVPLFASAMVNLAAAPYVEHCDFIHNKGLLGGAVTNTFYASPVFNRCVFRDNSAEAISVMLNYLYSSAVVVNCLMEGNFCSGYQYEDLGTEIIVKYSNSVIVNALISSASLINTTIANNKAVTNPTDDEGPLIFNLFESAASLTNSIVWGNKTSRIEDSLTVNPSEMTYSLIEGLPADPESHMQDGLTTDAFFLDTANGNFQLAAPGPLINGGINDALTAALAPYMTSVEEEALDLAGNKRIEDGLVDIGAYETAGDPLPVNLQYYSAAWQGGLAALHWISGVEPAGLERYEIEKSLNAKDFHKIAAQKATGSNSTYDYTTPQAEPAAYYRLKAVESNGKFDYSAVARVVRDANGNSGAGINDTRLYPNPARNYINVSVAADCALLMYNASGNLVKSVNLKAGVNKIDISEVSAGAYFCIVGGQKLQFVKISN